MIGAKVENKLTGYTGQVISTEIAKNSDDVWVEMYVVAMENRQVLSAPKTMWKSVDNG